MIYDEEILKILNDIDLEISAWEKIRWEFLLKSHLESITMKYFSIKKVVNKNIYNSCLFTFLSFFISVDLTIITFLYFYLKLKNEFELLRKIKLYINSINHEII